MQQKISRRKLALYVADQFTAGASLEQLIREIAAYLIDSRRTGEAELVARAIEDTLAQRGTIIAHVTTAHPLDESLRASIQTLVGAAKLYVDETVDPAVIGGIRIETPGRLLDATMKRKLLALRQAKV